MFHVGGKWIIDCLLFYSQSLGSKLKQFVITVSLFLVSNLATANLLQHSISHAVEHKSIVATTLKYVNPQTVSNLADLHLDNEKLSKIEVVYSKLFEYSSHINQTSDHDRLRIFWNHALISTAIDAATSQKDWASAHLDSHHDILKFVANSFNDNYVSDVDNTDTHINEVPLPAAIWLFSSALMLFAFARRSSI